MSAVAITIAALLADSTITGFTTAARVHPIKAPPFTGAADQHPNEIVVNLIHEDDECLLSGAAQFAEARVSIECRSASGRVAIEMGEAVKRSLQATLGRYIANHTAWFFKEGTDVTEYNDAIGVSRRTIDFYVRWH